MADLVFPMEKAKKLRDDPRKRYEFALQYLPLPAAFREAAKGLRAIVRERKREDEPYEEPLRRLYALACVQDLVRTEDVPVYRPLPSDLWKDLAFPYEKIGYKSLDLLGERNRGRIRNLWGEPEQHRNVADVLPEIGTRFVAHREAEKQREEKEWEERKARVDAEYESQPEGCGCLVLLGASVGGILPLLV